VPALLLGPLAVDCAHEGKGIGGALMRAAITEARDRGHGAVLLVGDPEYYERFGFFADKAQHLVMPGPFERRRFLALELKDGWLDGAAGVLVASGRRLSAERRKAA
jgi:predicted N-acetyltransferase YhbS